MGRREVEEQAIKSDKGDKWSLEKPLIISGHIHEYQKLQENIIYTGTPYMTKYGENQDKIILMLDYGQKLNMTPIDLKMSKKKIINTTLKDLETIKINSNDDVKIKITLDVTEYKSISDEKKRLIQLIKTKGIKVIFNIKNINRKKTIKTNVGFMETLKQLIKGEEELKIYEEILREL